MHDVHDTLRRSALTTLLREHAPFDEKEHADLELMLQLVETLARPFSADEPTAHFTGSALVLDGSRERVCLVHHRKLGRWLQPGGHVEDTDASVLAAALREAAEETGLAVRPASEQLHDVDVHEFPRRGERAAHLHLDCRFVLIAADAEPQASAESHAVRWFPLAEAATLDDASLRRMIDRL